MTRVIATVARSRESARRAYPSPNRRAARAVSTRAPRALTVTTAAVGTR